MPAITASTLYNLVICPHRVAMDCFEDPAKRDPISPFVQLLWERGTKYELEVISELKLPFTYLKDIPVAERVNRKLEAMDRGDALIYGARIESDDLVGEPDLLRKEAGGYAPIDIKSGSGEEGDEDSSKPKEHYAVHLGLYLDILTRLGHSPALKGYVWMVRPLDPDRRRHAQESNTGIQQRRLPGCKGFT